MDYENMSLAELKETAKKAGLKGISALRKQELAERLKALNPSAQASKTVTKEAVKEIAPEIKKRERPQEPPKTERLQELPRAAGKETGNAAKPMVPTSPQQVVRETAAASEVQPVQQHRTFYNAGGQNSGTNNAYHRAQQNNRQDYRNNGNRNNNNQQQINRPQVNTQPQQRTNTTFRQPQAYADPTPDELASLDSGETKEGILEIMSEGFGFIRCDNFLPGENDVYVSPAQIRRHNLKTGDIIVGNTRVRSQSEKFSALLYIKNVNGFPLEEALRRKRFEDLTPIFPNERIHLETPNCKVGVRMMDLVSPIGKGQRGMLVSPPKAGKTTLLKQVAAAVTKNHPEMHLIILLIDERPEEVTDIKESIEGKNVEVIYSTFDELPENHKRVSEMVVERARRLVEHRQDVMILLDSITRLTRAYNLVVPPSGRTLSGGLDPAALHMPKKFFGAARNIREGGSLTILATALVETGSRMDDVVFEEFKGTGNMELVLDRSLSEKRIFPAIDLHKSSTRRDDLLLTTEEAEAVRKIHRGLSGMRADDALEHIIEFFVKTRNNREFMEYLKKIKF